VSVAAGSRPVLHVTEDMAAVSGGVPAVVRQLSRRWAGLGERVTVLHAKGDASDLADVAEVLRCPPQGIGRAWSLGPALRPTLSGTLARLAGQGGVLHVHGLWTAPATLAPDLARRSGVPAVFTAHGMLVPWLWNQQGAAVRLKKAAFWRLLGAPALRQCGVVHAITPMERDELQALLPASRIEVIPNAIELASEPEVGAGSTRPAAPERDHLILFLGRIEPKKGADILIRAFARAVDQGLGADWRLCIAGPPWSERYLGTLQALVRDSGLGSRVEFTGAVFGAAKQALLARAWVLAVPSHSEVVGLVNLEAAAASLPSITTHQTGLWDWEEGGGLLIQPDDDALARALLETAGWSAAEQRQRGQASRRLVQRRYSWQAVLPQWRALYDDLASR
jgi:glycosyltransferase involved in cell wall biosynthesis